jgi:DNA-directed RNA polymerase specialized sigma24 family protein
MAIVGSEGEIAERRAIAYRLARSMRMSEADAQDVAQETGKRLATISEAAPSRALVLTIARNVAIDLLRVRAREWRHDGGSADDVKVATPERPADEVRYEQEVFAQVRERLVEMPDSPRAVIRKHYLEGSSLVEIVAWRVAETPRGDGESEDAHHKRCADWVHMNHTRGLRWLRERIAR